MVLIILSMKIIKHFFKEEIELQIESEKCKQIQKNMMFSHRYILSMFSR